MSKSGDFSVAYAKQANSDLQVYDELRRLDSIPKCHRLHYLQMAAEKACKAHLYSVQTGPVGHSFSHQVAEKVFSVWMRRFPALYSGGMRQEVKRFAHEIDRLAPAVDREARPDNSEYPWEDKRGRVVAPCLHPFPDFDDMSFRFTATLKIIRLMTSESLASPASSSTM